MYGTPYGPLAGDCTCRPGLCPYNCVQAKAIWLRVTAQAPGGSNIAPEQFSSVTDLVWKPNSSSCSRRYTHFGGCVYMAARKLQK